jgi:hypothetical protein
MAGIRLSQSHAGLISLELACWKMTPFGDNAFQQIQSALVSLVLPADVLIIIACDVAAAMFGSG